MQGERIVACVKKALPVAWKTSLWFLKIMLPQVIPALFAVGIITFIGLWNDYFTPFMYLKNHQTLAVGIYRLQQSFETRGGNWPVVFAAMVLSSVPIIIVFSIFQNIVRDGVAVGAVFGFAFADSILVAIEKELQNALIVHNTLLSLVS